MMIKRVFTTIVLLTAIAGSLSLYSSEKEKTDSDIERLFRWSIMDYASGKYRDVVRNLEVLLYYCNTEEDSLSNPDSTPKQGVLEGKIYLLKGAAHEQLGQIEKAKDSYRLAAPLLKKTEIEGIDLNTLDEYRRVVVDWGKQNF